MINQNLGFDEEDFIGQEKSARRKDMAGAFAGWLNSMTINPDPNLPQVLQAAQLRRADKIKGNRTVNMLEKAGRTDLADMVKAGTLDPKQAAAQLFAEAGERRAFERQKALYDYKFGLDQKLASAKTVKPLTQLAKIKADFDAGLLSQEDYKIAVETFASKNKMGVRVGPDGTMEFVQGADLPKLTEAQSKDINWAARMTGALQAFEPVADVLTSPTDKLFGLDPTGLARYGQSGDYQKAEVAGLEFLAPLLRKDTGAAVTPKEWDFYSRIYIPTVGDQPEALSQKRAARTRALEALKLGIPPEYVTRVQAANGDPVQQAISEGVIEAPAAQQQPAAGGAKRIEYDAQGNRISG